MSRIRIFDLCDSAVNRDGFLTVVNGGLNQFIRDEYPAPLACMMAISVEIDGKSPGDVFTLRLSIETKDGDAIDIPPLDIQGEYAGDPTAKPGQRESLIVAVSINVSAMVVPEPGTYRFRLDDDGDHLGFIEFYVKVPVDADAPFVVLSQ